MNKIKVTPRHDDFHACLDGNPGIWGCGTTPSAAIGDMIRSHPERFDVEIEYTYRLPPKKQETE